MEYEQIKQTARKYLAPFIVGAALAFGTNAYANNTLPVSQEAKASVERVIETENKTSKRHIENAVKAFNEGVSDGYFSRKEQKQVYKFFREARENKRAYNEVASEAEKKLYNLVSDSNRDSNERLKSALKEQGLEIKVQGHSVYTTIRPAIIGGINTLMVILARAYFIKKNK